MRIPEEDSDSFWDRITGRTSGPRLRRAVILLPAGFHGRWENLTLSDLQFLYKIGVDFE